MKTLDRKFSDKELELIAIALSYHFADYDENSTAWKEGLALQSYFNDKANETVTPPNKVIKPEYDKRHGGPWDRGSADSYYGRHRNPHYYVGGTGHTEPLDFTRMSQSEIEAYYAGYEWNEKHGDKKDY